jgi:UDP-glucuronate decarboxylase
VSRILVTGGAGFVGSHLCERLLSDGHTVICLDNLYTGSNSNIAHLQSSSNFTFLEHDVTLPTSLEVEQIYHLACPASPIQYQRHPVDTIRTAIIGTEQMLTLANATGARILIASTSEVYGDPLVHPQVETYWGNVNPVGPRACYDEGKRAAEALTVAYTAQYGVDARIARIFNTYGPRLHAGDGRVVSNFIDQARRGEPITIYGDGSQTRSFCYVSDLIDGLIRLMALSHDPGPVNLGNPTEHTIKELASVIVKLTGSTSSLTFNPLPVDDPQQRQPDISKARQLLNWEPRVTLEEGIQKTIAAN